MSGINPFPQYPVSQLDENLSGIDRRTWVTEPIRQERAVIANWIEHPETPLIVAVLGEYGSGKTHLLLDAMATLRRELDDRRPRLSFLPVVALAESPLGWYRAEIGPKLADLPLEDLVLELYAEAGKEVAGRAELTEASVEALDRKPELILRLVQGDLLSPTEVEAVFRRMLREALPGAHLDILQAFALLRWDTAEEATRWLAGGELPQDLAERLDLPSSISTDERALDILLAVAALHHARDRVFALFVDEAEHFLRTESEGSQNPNVTSMKRLLEGLANRHAIVFVAGHWSAWQTLRDYHDRFSPSTPIEMETLTGDQVRLMVAARVPDAPDFGAEQSALVASLGRGNMRAITSLLRELYEQSGDFLQPLSPSVIETASDSITQRPKPETILLHVHELLESFDFRVSRGGSVAGAKFDLVAFQGDRPQVVVILKYASHEIAQGEQVRRMIARMRKVNERYPETVGCFLSEGRIDEAVRKSLKAGTAQRIVLGEVTGPGFIANISGQLRPLLNAPMTPADLEQLDRSRLQAIAELDRLQTARGHELDRVLTSQEPGEIEDSEDSPKLLPRRTDYRDRLTVVYEELTRRPPFTSRLSRIWRPLTYAAALSAGLGLAIFVFTVAQGSIFGNYYLLANLFIAVQYFAAFTFIILGAGVIIRDLSRIDRFYEYRNQKLRSLYLQSEDPLALIRQNEELQEILETHGSRWPAAVFHENKRLSASHH